MYCYSKKNAQAKNTTNDRESRAITIKPQSAFSLSCTYFVFLAVSDSSSCATRERIATIMSPLKEIMYFFKLLK